MIKTEPSDLEISQAHQQWQEDYERFYSMLVRFCTRLLGDCEEALDVVSDTFLRYREMMNLNKTPVCHKKAWLYRCAGNLCRDRLRRFTSFRRLFFQPQFLPRSVESEENRAEETQRAEQWRAVLDRLAVRDKLLLSLYVDELSYAEMAMITGIKPNSIGKILSRALGRFSRAVERLNKGESK